MRSLALDAAALELLEQARWPSGPVCPFPSCGSSSTKLLEPANGLDRRTGRGSRSSRRIWRCSSCRRQFSATTGSLWHGTHVPPAALVEFGLAWARGEDLQRHGIARRWGVTPKTAARMRDLALLDELEEQGPSLFQRLRELDEAHGEASRLLGSCP